MSSLGAVLDKFTDAAQRQAFDRLLERARGIDEGDALAFGIAEAATCAAWIAELEDTKRHLQRMAIATDKEIGRLTALLPSNGGKGELPAYFEVFEAVRIYGHPLRDATHLLELVTAHFGELPGRGVPMLDQDGLVQIAADMRLLVKRLANVKPKRSRKKAAYRGAGDLDRPLPPPRGATPQRRRG